MSRDVQVMAKQNYHFGINHSLVHFAHNIQIFHFTPKIAVMHANLKDDLQIKRYLFLCVKDWILGAFMVHCLFKSKSSNQQ